MLLQRQLPKQSTTISFWNNSLPVFGVSPNSSNGNKTVVSLLEMPLPLLFDLPGCCSAITQQSTTINLWYNPLPVFGVSFVTHQTLVMAIKLLSACWGCTHHFCFDLPSNYQSRDDEQPFVRRTRLCKKMSWIWESLLTGQDCSSWIKVVSWFQQSVTWNLLQCLLTGACQQTVLTMMVTLSCKINNDDWVW